MSQPISAFTEVVRILLGDLDDETPSYPTAGVDRAVRGCVLLRSVSGLEVDPSRTGIRQSDLSDPTPDQFALVCFKTARIYVAANPDTYESRTRALQEKFAGWTNLLSLLENSIHDLENGTMFAGQQQLDSFLMGNRGLKLGFVASEMTGAYPHRSQQYPTLSGGDGGTLPSVPY